ncbi:DUF1501 domain-containing protein [Anthocerotibacter panamensis]|uniref:DUF1501 domain-containing protein n=1 Tax=Anthocerotibacter panamensis TaxID=2857077 RepID=UPI001C4040D9|nr:DUF1501 domain-containing protein [Anthocerotibacter panamensis]
MKRRDFTGILLSAATFLAAQPQRTWAKDQRTLILIELAGGNDGLNTFIPYRDPNYLRLRGGSIAIQDGLPVSPTVALHPALKDLQPILDSGRLAVVQNVGYPNPELSHFRSKEVWQSARPQGSPESGWLARYLEAQGAKAMDAVFLGEEYPLALTGDGPRYLQLSPNLGLKSAGKLGQAIQALYAVPQRQQMAEQVRRTLLESNQAVQQLARDLDRSVDQHNYPKGPLGQQLALVGRLLKTSPQVIYLTIGGWDTHANQTLVQQRLLTQVGQGLAALHRDLTDHGLAQNVLIQVQSEFGRRPAPNGSGGTDHGTAGPVLLMGPVRAGFYGGEPALDSLQNGNLPMQVDFRQVYAEVLNSWFQTQPKTVLKGTFEPVGFLGRG